MQLGIWSKCQIMLQKACHPLLQIQLFFPWQRGWWGSPEICSYFLKRKLGVLWALEGEGLGPSQVQPQIPVPSCEDQGKENNYGGCRAVDVPVRDTARFPVCNRDRFFLTVAQNACRRWLWRQLSWSTCPWSPTWRDLVAMVLVERWEWCNIAWPTFSIVPCRTIWMGWGSTLLSPWLQWNKQPKTGTGGTWPISWHCWRNHQVRFGLTGLRSRSPGCGHLPEV